MANRGEIRIGRSHGQRVPPLIKVIINTLKNYPDGSQILKELIQNADDACATEVEFLLDYTQHGSDNLIHPSVARYQGPALYAWNNSLFEEEDWEGIRDIGVSRKEGEVLKVGRFALGFISVYHITDFPCILSNEDILMLDPHMVIDHTGGLRIRLNEFTAETCLASQLQSFLNYFGYNGTTQYNGTIFRFPLRTGCYETSLPNNVYNPDKVLETLFGPFRQEIENCLLFLKRVTTIRVSVKESSGIKLLYSAEIDPRFRDSLLSHRMEMFEFVEKRGYLTSSHVYLSIFPTCFMSGTEDTRLWLVLNILGVSGQDPHLNQLRTSFSLHSDSYLPWFALALPLPCTTDCVSSGLCWSLPLVNMAALLNHIDCIQIPAIPLSNEVRDFIGNLFCFLPIAARSNFPFHIHGYFALSTNRRSIKWPRFDDHSEESCWNMQLVSGLGTQCYAILIYLLISKFGIGGDVAFQYSLWSCLPSVQDAQQLNGVIHRGALALIQDKPLLFTKGSSRWIQIDHALFLPSSFNLVIPHEHVCNELLIALSQSVVNLSVEIADVITRYEFLEQKFRPKLVTPNTIRGILKDFKSNKNLLNFLTIRENVSSLLEIILFDIKFPSSNISAVIKGIRLIPICNLELPGTFGEGKYFISERPQKIIKLFPGLENVFVDPFLPQSTSSLLLKLGRTGRINLKDITDIRKDPTLFVELLEKSMGIFFDLKSPIKWTPGVDTQPEREWIELVWKFIEDSKIIEELKRRKFPILPKNFSSEVVELLPLSRLPYIEGSGETAYQEIERFLEDSGCHICERIGFIPSFYNYVYHPLPRGLFPMLQFQTVRKAFLQKIASSDNSARMALRKIILSIELLTPNVQLTKSFPIFISISNHWVTMDRFNQYFLPPNSVPREFSRYPENFLSPFNNANIHLCEKVGIVNLSLDETIQHHLVPILCNENISNFPQERNLLSLWILKISSSLAENVIQILRSNKWLLGSSTNSDRVIRAKLYSPSELFYPNDPHIMQLCTSVPFPNEIYAQHLNILVWLGLQTGESITYNSLKTIVNSSLQNIPSSSTANYTNWIIALIQLLSIHLDRLNLATKREFWDLFQRIRFIKPSSISLCHSYPTCLPYYAQLNILSVPSQITLCSEKQACLIAGVTAVLVENLQSESHQVIYKYLGVKTSVTLSLVCEQVKLIVQTFRDKRDILVHSEIHSLMKKIYKYFGITFQNKSQIIGKPEILSIFIPVHGFVNVERVVLSCSENLSPYIFSLDRYYSVSDSHLSRYFQLLNIDSNIDLNKCQFILQSLSADVLSPENVHLALAIIHFYYDLIKSAPTPEDCLILAEDSRIYPAKDCIFNDLKWMEHSPLFATEKVVHLEITHSIANKFGCRPASIALAPVTENFGLGCGQSENFLDRLRGILKGYRMEMDVFKELIQNSDDAGAHQVKILFDYSSYSCESILDPKMSEVQGPALYFFNDSQFTSQDLDSIIQLSKGTKLSLTDKIGRFGVGFNAVYNFTDCPSFISGGVVQIFDPLQVYVGQFRRDSGVRFRYLEGDTRNIETYHDLFEVYEGIFGCNILKCHTYPHTLFRLPFRKNPSKISEQTFDKDGIFNLQKIVQQELELLILFLQNITCIEVYERRQRGNVKFLIRVSKSECQTMHFLQNNKEYFQSFLRLDRPRSIASSSDIVSICSESLTGKTCQKFILSYASGIGACFDIFKKFVQYNLTFLPLCGVAIPLSFLEIIPSRHTCSLYTFLPLPILSPLLMHINGYFSLSDSRKNLSDASSGKCQDLPTEWNMALINDALPNALICALERLHTLEPLSSTSDPRIYSNYFALWPVESSTEFLWKKFPQHFAERIVNTFNSIELFSSARNPRNWVAFNECSFLSLQSSLSENETFLNCVYTLCYNSKIIIFANLPNRFYSTKLFTIFSKLKPDKIYDLKKVCDVIFPLLETLTIDQLETIFNALIPLCNVESYNWLFCRLQQNKFIPCKGNKSPRFVLRRPPEVVFPNSKISKLYHPQDENQPVTELHNRFDHTKRNVFTQVLKNMGVMCDSLPESEIVGRCEITCNLTKVSSNTATQHAVCLMEYLYTAVNDDETFMARIYTDLKIICFIPTYKDPLCGLITPPLDDFVAPTNCFPFHTRHLVTPIVPSASDAVRDISTVLPTPSEPPLEVVFQVLDTLNSFSDNISSSSVDMGQKMSTIYEYLARVYNISNLDFIKQKLSCISWVFHPGNRRFYSTDKTIILPDFLEFENEYLISFPYRDLLNDKNFEIFLEKIGMQKFIDDGKIIACLQQLHQTFADNPLPEDLVKFALRLIGSIRDTTFCSNKVYILSRKNILHRPNELFVSFSPHLEKFLTAEKSKLFVHGEIFPLKAFELNVKPSEQVFSDSFEFGLEEQITDRIQNLIREMPMSSLIKELIQNAEDAEATEILFILDEEDYGNHNSKLCLPDALYPNWKKLNSYPSLCVYNNKGFSTEDLEGIQTLSVGGKRRERESIGKFGLGFSSVYRITDAPTFISSKANREGLTFCCFDPFLKYTTNQLDSNVGRKRGLRIDIGYNENFEKFADQLIPFEFRSFQNDPVLCESLTNVWNNGDFTMFRLPLDIELETPDTTNTQSGMHKPYRRREARKHYSLKEISDEIVTTIEGCPEMLLFLKNVRKLKVISIDKQKRVSLQCSLSVEQLKRGSTPLLDGHPFNCELLVEIRQITIKSRNINKNKYLIYSLPDMSTEKYLEKDQTLKEYSGKYLEEKLWGFGGVAVRVFPLEQCQSKLFTFLPLPIHSDIPVHINAPLILDSSRQNIHSRREDWEDSWHSSVVKFIIVPLYAKLLLDLRYPANSILYTPIDKEEYFNWYYSLFPKRHHNSILPQISQELYNLLYDSNHSILLAHNLDISENRIWYPLHGANCGVFKPSTFFSMPKQEGNGRGDQLLSIFTEFYNKEDQIRKSLFMIKYPLTFAPSEILVSFEPQLMQLDPSKLLVYLRDNITKLFNQNDTIHLSHSILEFGQLQTILEYILRAECKDLESEVIPLRVDVLDDLRCFSRDQPSYLSKYASLLPHRNEDFVSEKYSPLVISKLRTLGFVESLDVDYLAQHLVTLQISTSQCKLFWKFVLEKKLNQDDLIKFADHKLVPLQRSLCLVKYLKFVLTDKFRKSDLVLFNALSKLECPMLSLDYFADCLNDSLLVNITSLFDGIAISVTRPPDTIIGSLELANPNCSSISLDPDEANKLVHTFSQLNFNTLNENQLAILSSLKIFLTLSNSYYTLAQCDIVFFSIENLLVGQELFKMLLRGHRLVVFHPISSQLLEPLCNVLHKKIIDVNDLLLNFVFRLITEIPFGEQICILRYISSALAGEKNGTDKLISSLAEIPFIRSHNSLYKVKDLYSPEIVFVSTFLPHLSLPEVWTKKNLDELFTKLGLQKQVSLEDIFRIAKSISQDYQRYKEDLPILLNQLSEILCNVKWDEMGERSTNSLHLRRIGEITFLPSWKRDCITNNCVTTRLAKFRDAQLNKFQNCCCTSAYIHSFNFEFPPESYPYLNIIEKPEYEIVKEHLMNISIQVANECQGSNQREEIELLLNVPNGYDKYFKSSYCFLEKYCGPRELGEFRNLACILWENTLYYPINMLFTSSDELHQFVIQIPPKLAADYPKFMSKIGVKEKANYSHFAYVLSKINYLTRGKALVDSEFFEQAVSVFNFLIRDLRRLNSPDPPSDLDLSCTMLLTMSSELHPSSEVIYADNLSLLSRANKLNINFKILNTLEPDEKKSCVPPSCLRLRRLSEILVEKLTSSLRIIQPTDLNLFLKELICSTNFYRVLRRLYYHLTKLDLNNIFMKNGETFLKDENNPPEGYCTVSQVLQNLTLISVQRIDLEYYSNLSGESHSMRNACSCYVDKDTFYLSNLQSMNGFILEDIAFQINGYLGNIFKEVLNCFQLCFTKNSSDLVIIMDKLDEYNIIRDPWPLPDELDPKKAVRNLRSGNPSSGFYGSGSLSRPRPEGISLGEPDVPAAKLSFKISQCDLLAAKKLITTCEHNSYVFPAHACFLCFESLLKAFKALLHLRGSSNRLMKIHDVRKHLEFVKFILSTDDHLQLYSKIEQLTLPLLNYDIDTCGASTSFLPTIGCLIPQQIYSLSQAKEAIVNTNEVISSLKRVYLDLNSASLSESDLIFSCSEPAIIATIRTVEIDDAFCLSNLSPECEEFKRISWRFFESMSHASIIFIQKVHNFPCWITFKDKIIEEFQKHGDSCLNFKFLFHGTCNNHPEVIARDKVGFNLCYSQGGLWGRGIYFAYNSSYSHQNYSFSVGDGTCCLIAASVFIGYSKELAENRSIGAPPLMPNSGERYHTVQGKHNGEVIHTIYQSCFAYPAYIITYKPAN